MSVTLAVAAAKWARAVRERQAATAAQRKAKVAVRDAPPFSQARAAERDCDKRVAEARKEERRVQKALLRAVEKSDALSGDVVDV